MKKIEISNCSENFFNTIGKEWMLITAGNKEKFNTMTANWGGIGYLWNKPVVFIFVRPERYTFEFVEKNAFFTLSFLGEEHKEIHKICGSKSGKDTDKIKTSGLIPIFNESENIFFEQARLSLECKKLYSDSIKENNFTDLDLFEKWYTTKGNPHKMYVAEITGMWIKE